jgi:glutamine synthetase
LLQGAREEVYNAPFRRHLRDSGVPVETSKAEAGIGQHELNVKFADALTMGDRHTVYKQCLKEVAEQLGASVTFMSKPYSNTTGSGCHIHLSLHNKDDGKNVFPGENQFGPVKCSNLFKWFLGGWLKFTPEMMPMYAGNINSYKRFVSSSWAPTRLAWSYDNRTAGFRVVGSGKSLRIECRIPGADANVYLAFAASLASGLEGIEQRIEPPPIFEGNIYAAKQIPEVPKTLHQAVDLFEKSAVAKKAFGENVVRHYSHFFRSEQAAYDKFVTDWERVRYFERI